MLKKIVLSLLGIAILLLGSYLYFIHSKPILDEERRKGAEGAFLRLSKGIVHYELLGSADAPTVVLVHGLTTPYYIWDHTVGGLLDAGFRVLRYDHYGRGLSDRPEGPYNTDLFDRQLLELLDALGIRTPVHLVGLSMGGAVSVTFTDRHPERVSRLCLISPLSFPMEDSFKTRLALVPLVGDYVMAVAGDGILEKGAASSLLHPERFPDYLEKFRVQLRYRGYREAILSTLRCLDYGTLQDAYLRVGRQDRPKMLFWGREDAVLPFSMSDKVRKAMPGILFQPVEASGHCSNYETPGKVTPALCAFLKGG